MSNWLNQYQNALTAYETAAAKARETGTVGDRDAKNAASVALRQIEREAAAAGVAFVRGADSITVRQVRTKADFAREAEARERARGSEADPHGKLRNAIHRGVRV